MDEEKFREGNEDNPLEVEFNDRIGCGCGTATEAENLGCCDVKGLAKDSGDCAETPEDELPCCEDVEENKSCGEPLGEEGEPSEVPCCGDVAPEGTGCGCGGEFPDQSLITNPEKPEEIAGPDFFAELERLAHLMGIASVGYTQVIPPLVNTEEPPEYPNAIVLTYPMGMDIIESPPGPEAQKLNDATYLKLGNITYALSDFIRAQGFATQVAHPYGGLLNFSPLGQKAGLGWMGQSGLLITPELGPRLKISAILTSIENLPITKPKDYSWILEYCDVCGKCIKACPEEAMLEKESCCGGKQIEFLESRCIGCSQGCTYCIEECPFHKKGYQPVKDKFRKMKAKLKERGN